MRSRKFYVSALFFAALSLYMPTSSFCEAVVSVPYHGMRMSQRTSFFVRRISIQEADGNCMFDVLFNAAVDPRSVEADSILINGESLPPQTEILFNKAGTEMQIKILRTFLSNAFLETNDAAITLTINAGTSFDGTGLEQSEFTDLVCGNSYVYEDGNGDGSK